METQDLYIGVDVDFFIELGLIIRFHPVSDRVALLSTPLGARDLPVMTPEYGGKFRHQCQNHKVFVRKLQLQ